MVGKTKWEEFWTRTGSRFRHWVDDVDVPHTRQHGTPSSHQSAREARQRHIDHGSRRHRSSPASSRRRSPSKETPKKRQKRAKEYIAKKARTAGKWVRNKVISVIIMLVPFAISAHYLWEWCKKQPWCPPLKATKDECNCKCNYKEGGCLDDAEITLACESSGNCNDEICDCTQPTCNDLFDIREYLNGCDKWCGATLMIIITLPAILLFRLVIVFGLKVLSGWGGLSEWISWAITIIITIIASGIAASGKVDFSWIINEVGAVSMGCEKNKDNTWGEGNHNSQKDCCKTKCMDLHVTPEDSITSGGTKGLEAIIEYYWDYIRDCGIVIPLGFLIWFIMFIIIIPLTIWRGLKMVFAAQPAFQRAWGGAVDIARKRIAPTYSENPMVGGARTSQKGGGEGWLETLIGPWKTVVMGIAGLTALVIILLSISPTKQEREDLPDEIRLLRDIYEEYMIMSRDIIEPVSGLPLHEKINDLSTGIVNEIRPTSLQCKNINADVGDTYEAKAKICSGISCGGPINGHWCVNCITGESNNEADQEERGGEGRGDEGIHIGRYGTETFYPLIEMSSIYIIGKYFGAAAGSGAIVGSIFGGPMGIIIGAVAPGAASPVHNVVRFISKVFIGRIKNLFSPLSTKLKIGLISKAIGRIMRAALTRGKVLWRRPMEGVVMRGVTKAAATALRGMFKMITKIGKGVGGVIGKLFDLLTLPFMYYEVKDFQSFRSYVPNDSMVIDTRNQYDDMYCFHLFMDPYNTDHIDNGRPNIEDQYPSIAQLDLIAQSRINESNLEEAKPFIDILNAYMEARTMVDIFIDEQIIRKKELEEGIGADYTLAAAAAASEEIEAAAAAAAASRAAAIATGGASDADVTEMIHGEDGYYAKNEDARKKAADVSEKIPIIPQQWSDLTDDEKESWISVFGAPGGGSEKGADIAYAEFEAEWLLQGKEARKSRAESDLVERSYNEHTNTAGAPYCEWIQNLNYYNIKVISSLPSTRDKYIFKYIQNYLERGAIDPKEFMDSYNEKGEQPPSSNKWTESLPGNIQNFLNLVPSDHPRYSECDSNCVWYYKDLIHNYDTKINNYNCSGVSFTKGGVKLFNKIIEWESVEYPPACTGTINSAGGIPAPPGSADSCIRAYTINLGTSETDCPWSGCTYDNNRYEPSNIQQLTLNLPIQGRVKINFTDHYRVLSGYTDDEVNNPIIISRPNNLQFPGKEGDIYLPLYYPSNGLIELLCEKGINVLKELEAEKAGTIACDFLETDPQTGSSLAKSAAWGTWDTGCTEEDIGFKDYLGMGKGTVGATTHIAGDGVGGVIPITNENEAWLPELFGVGYDERSGLCKYNNLPPHWKSQISDENYCNRMGRNDGPFYKCEDIRSENLTSADTTNPEQLWSEVLEIISSILETLNFEPLSGVKKARYDKMVGEALSLRGIQINNERARADSRSAPEWNASSYCPPICVPKKGGPSGDTALCAAITDLDTAEACEAVSSTASTPADAKACTYIHGNLLYPYCGDACTLRAVGAEVPTLDLMCEAGSIVTGQSFMLATNRHDFWLTERMGEFAESGG